ncbi:DNA-binding IclR family transcriptional regulator OS=Castellaniella defragrans OX=75697 GN=HNR28_001216 PE=4 SV=1 [Castellaniella defragrans]
MAILEEPDENDNRDIPLPGDEYVRALARGLEVLKALNHPGGQTLTDVAQRTGLTRASARRLLLTLAATRYVKQDGRRFSLLPKVMELGYAYLNSQPITSVAAPYVEQLVESVHESCSIAVLDETEIVYIVRFHTHKIMRANLSVGSRLPALWTSMGRVLLSGLPDQQITEMIAQADKTKLTDYTNVDDGRLYEDIVQVRKQGWCIVDQELEYGLISIAAPIKTRQGRSVAALNISSRAGQGQREFMEKELLPRLLRTAAKISQSLYGTYGAMDATGIPLKIQ